jgi:hypothetical protein
MENYYFLEGENRRGPFSLDQLKTYEISFDTPIWKDGRNEWVPAGEVGELVGVVLPSEAAWNVRIESKRLKRVMWTVVAVLVVIGIGLWKVMRSIRG